MYRCCHCDRCNLRTCRFAWKLKGDPPPDAIKLNLEMELKNSKLSRIVNPILKVLFHDWLEKKLSWYISTRVCPDIPTYIPQQYTDLYGQLLAKAAESKIHFRANADLAIPRDPTTVYLQDRLEQQLELQ